MREIENIEHILAPTGTHSPWMLLAPFSARTAQAEDRRMSVSREHQADLFFLEPL